MLSSPLLRSAFATALDFTFLQVAAARYRSLLVLKCTSLIRLNSHNSDRLLKDNLSATYHYFLAALPKTR